MSKLSWTIYEPIFRTVGWLYFRAWDHNKSRHWYITVRVPGRTSNRRVKYWMNRILNHPDINEVEHLS